MRKRCVVCGCYLDPGEWCDCEQPEQPEQEMARRPVKPSRTVFPLEYNTREYVEQRWREWELR